MARESMEISFLINTIYTQVFHLLVILDLYTSERFRRYEMKKPFMAVLIALLVTACVGASIFAIGGAALVNKNGVTASNSAAQASNVSAAASSQQADQVGQLQSLVSQYQDREQQYQQREKQLQDQLAQANTQIQQDQQTLQQVQMLLAALQQRGLIRLTSDGRIVITQ
jgi:predicted Rossmann fold nucleotide-binding protein DprA/Smf involved in DNA uptake